MTTDPRRLRPRQRDSIDRLMREWKRERPDIDPWPLEIIGRVQRLSGHLLRHAERVLSAIGLTWETFSLIVTLRRSGRPYALRPTDIYRESLLTSGAITNRIDRVEKLGLVTRLPDSKDRRGVIVKLTPEGRALADRAIKLHFEGMAEVLSALSPTDRQQAARVLARLLASLESETGVAGGRNRKAQRPDKGPRTGAGRGGSKAAPRAARTIGVS